MNLGSFLIIVVSILTWQSQHFCFVAYFAESSCIKYKKARSQDDLSPEYKNLRINLSSSSS